MSASRSLAAACMLACAGGIAQADDPAVTAQGDAKPDAKEDDLELRLTVSSFLFRQSGDDAPPLFDMGAPVENASPVRRYFGDLRLELGADGVKVDARIRQTSSERYQSGAAAGSEYEIRTLSGRLGSARTSLTIGRQYIDAVAATKIDGIALVKQLSKTWSATVFAGAYPQLGSRSLDTDYPEIRQLDGTLGSAMIPISGGLGTAFFRGNLHGDLGIGAVYVAQEVPNATSSEASRVFATTSGYARPVPWLDIYHLGLLDLAGASGANLTNGSLGVNAHLRSHVQVTAAVHHVSTDVLQIAARSTLDEPDPTAIGIVQNNLAVIRVSQDLVRAGTSVALANARFELSLSGGLHSRPAVAVALADGSSVSFPQARFADVTTTVLDRRSIAKLRASASATMTFPIGTAVPNRSRGTILRLAIGRPFLDGRGELEADVMAARFQDLAGGGMCTTSLDVFACYGASKTSMTQAGVVASWRVGREWMLLLDAHFGLQGVDSTSINGLTVSPTVSSLTMFARAQWRYR